MESGKLQGVFSVLLLVCVIILGFVLWSEKKASDDRFRGLEGMILRLGEDLDASKVHSAGGGQPSPTSIPAPAPQAATPPVQAIASSTPPAEVASVRCTDDACAQRVFVGCQPGAEIATGLDTSGGSSWIDYRYVVVGSGAQSHQCLIRSFYLKNPQPAFVGPTMTCVYDTRKPYLEAVAAPTGCQGDLAAILGF